jgi:hypothetical protein
MRENVLACRNWHFAPDISRLRTANISCVARGSCKAVSAAAGPSGYSSAHGSLTNFWNDGSRAENRRRGLRDADSLSQATDMLSQYTFVDERQRSNTWAALLIACL